ncbi:nuclease [Thiocapsa imhoffii]|uniref:Nuclease n=1 Tax=Thiocapsa imhoffii TaxID=382777 RepID=A0A9X0WHE8_9GAMM|nr:thermonuclease family protein [Thiocapsa imhoffii]MBK1644608.1 nuclease [Thiocapsa imhoffii]
MVLAWAIEWWGPGLVPANWSFAGNGQPCALDAVLDGDSLRVRCDGVTLEVRLYCIDAPELRQQPWGARSRAALRAIATPRLELRPIEQDRYGRTIAEVYTSETPRRSLNLELVRTGAAAVYPRYCEDSRFYRAERAARAARRGIWASDGTHQTPWTYRQGR